MGIHDHQKALGTRPIGHDHNTIVLSVTMIAASKRMALHRSLETNFGLYNWICDIRYWQRKFQETEVLWVSRCSNQAANLLAKGINRSTLFTHHFFCSSKSCNGPPQ